MPWRHSILVWALGLSLGGGCTSTTPRTEGGDAGARDAPTETAAPCPGPRCDSDGDGIPDVEEDRNGDGLLGCCLERCDKPAASQKRLCIPNADGCGGDQRCVAGRCTPSRSFHCAAGELDPTRADTFGDGVPDGARGHFVCRPSPPGKDIGRKTIQVQRDAAADWALGLEPDARYVKLALPTSKAREAAATIDFPDEELAGFVLSLPPPASADIQESFESLRGRLEAAFSPAELMVRALGTQGKSHGGYDDIVGTMVDLDLATALEVTTLRRRVVAALLGRGEDGLGALPPAFGQRRARYVLRFATVRRYAFARDAKGQFVPDSDGYPEEDASKIAERRLFVIGGLVSRERYAAHSLPSGWKLDDLANGGLLAAADTKLKEGCDVDRIRGPRVHDVIIALDEATVRAGLRRKLQKAVELLVSGLGVGARYCLTGMLDPSGPQAALAGRCCGARGGRLLGAGELDKLLACVADPPGEPEALAPGFAALRRARERLLPRAKGRPNKLDTRAASTLIPISHRRSKLTWEVLGRGVHPSQCELTSAQELKLRLRIESEVGRIPRSRLFPVTGRCGDSCQSEGAHGYVLAASSSGTRWLCEDTFYWVHYLVDIIAGHGSGPIRTSWIAIASSLRVSLAARVLERKRRGGFDYRAESASIVFPYFELPVASDNPLYFSYLYWEPRNPWW